MNILYLDTAAEKAGAMKILLQYYENVKNTEDKIYFLVSNGELKTTENITVVNLSWTKKSWLHRLWFDFFCLRKYEKKWNIDKIISLQNILPVSSAKEKAVYVHNILPLYKGKIKFDGNIKLWVYLNIISPLIVSSMKRADTVIVQREWIKNSFSKAFNINKEKFIVNSPEISIEKAYRYSQPSVCQFFYPTNAMPYKNLKVLCDACDLLNKSGISNYKVVITVAGTETKYVKKLVNFCRKRSLPVFFVGKLKTEEVFEMYSHSILVFPSILETVGLPLLEAKAVGCPILAADKEYAHETIGDYDLATYFPPYNSSFLADLMLAFIKRGLFNV